MKIQWRGFLMSLLFAFSNVVYLNLLWILFSLLGLGIFGVAPASIAVMKCYSDFSINGDYISVKQFFDFYKQNFKKANKLQIGFTLFIMLLLVSARILVVLMNVTGFIPFLYLFLIIILLILNLISLQTFEWYPAMKGFDRFKLAMFLLFRYPFRYLPVLFTLYFCYGLLSMKATFVLLAGISLPIAFISFLHRQVWAKFQADFPEFGMSK
ncbi:DUF624 domain-containing protein [Jeotgalibaca caeni]|uniref:DUF624 domain-containing protein n=1 Tax=Jeotgalibaca caeni TaxID=3028623 RepID=UPI00237E5C32|nr:DUF624 domain-containing protein [Jeotgalibaca caeni]MDE1548119.1 DUF624 domain-containing protein [Jeotgalibaca caeni]